MQPSKFATCTHYLLVLVLLSGALMLGACGESASDRRPPEWFDLIKHVPQGTSLNISMYTRSLAELNTPVHFESVTLRLFDGVQCLISLNEGSYGAPCEVVCDKGIVTVKYRDAKRSVFMRGRLLVNPGIAIVDGIVSVEEFRGKRAKHEGIFWATN